MAFVTTVNIFENAGDGVFAVDDDQNIVFWNASAEQLLGFQSKDVVGKKCYRFLAGRDFNGCPVCCHHCPILARCIRGEPVGNFDLITSRNDGREVLINVSTLRMPQERGNGEGSHSHLIHAFRYMGDAPAVQEGLRIQLLGTTRIARADGTLLQGSMWRRAKVRTLLAYLSLNRGLRVPCDILASGLWPDLTHRSANHNLNTTIYYLRHSLEPDMGRGNASRFVRYENNHYIFLDDGIDWLDIQQFEVGLRGARREADQKRGISLYRAALRYYRGDFQADVDSSWHWHQSERARLRNLYSAALEEMALLYEQLQQEAEAIEVYIQLLTFRPWHEAACRRLMLLKLKFGDPHAAVSWFLRMAESLSYEIGRSPTAQTCQLYYLAKSSL